MIASTSLASGIAAAAQTVTAEPRSRTQLKRQDAFGHLFDYVILGGGSAGAVLAESFE